MCHVQIWAPASLLYSAVGVGGAFGRAVSRFIGIIAVHTCMLKALLMLCWYTQASCCFSQSPQCWSGGRSYTDLVDAALTPL